ncbi:MAG: ribosomal RNA small subunit methyltransferase A [Candidatus Harrisonbacteria bacterium]|nr:ribosomal RNA small subunit methyltransferase A [Candidatus Harrisonbacteria bacterium]
MNKRLGQHFLVNKAAIKKIVAALGLGPNEIVIEIGPGEGALTFPLLKECGKLNCKVIGIEKDPQLGSRVEGLGDSKNLKIIIGDALKEIPKITKPYTLNPIPYKVVGNIPYYITGKLLRTLSELENKPELTVLMIQKEVAERIVAKPPRMNLLAATVQFWAEPKILFTLKPKDFRPPPKIDSAVIKLNPKPYTLNPKTYYKLLHIIFKQPRKTLLNNLKTGLNLSAIETENILKPLNVDPKSRPQDLSLEKIEKMAKFIQF